MLLCIKKVLAAGEQYPEIQNTGMYPMYQKIRQLGSIEHQKIGDSFPDFDQKLTILRNEINESSQLADALEKHVQNFRRVRYNQAGKPLIGEFILDNRFLDPETDFVWVLAGFVLACLQLDEQAGFVLTCLFLDKQMSCLTMTQKFQSKRK